MDQLEMNILYLCLALLGMITLYLASTRECLSARETTWLIVGVVGYFLIALSWEHFPVLTAILVGGMAFSRTYSLIAMATRGEYSLPLTLNWIVNAALLALLPFHPHNL